MSWVSNRKSWSCNVEALVILYIYYDSRLFSGTAHCADMYASSPSDPPQLVAARRKISDLIGQWLDEDSEHNMTDTMETL
jgi:hypothetical protein